MIDVETLKAIRAAIKDGDVDKVRSLIGSDEERLNKMTTFGTWLHVAASFGQLDVVKCLLDMGADVNAYGGTAGGGPLQVAASDGHLEVITYLISRGANLDVTEPERNPLFGAIHGGHTGIAKALIDAGIDTRIKYSGQSMKNMDARAFAREWGRSDIEALLSAHPPQKITEIKTTDAPPTDDDWAAINGAAEAGYALFNISAEPPDVVQEKIQKWVDDFLLSKVENPLGEDIAFALGALWGNAVCKAYGWQWIVPIRGDWRGLGVADPERRFLALPFDLFSKLLFKDPDQQMPGSVIRYKAIAAKHLPDSAPGRYAIITS